jgi:multiple sugar transport system substrate-binding protein
MTLTRRALLGATTAGAGALALAGCGGRANQDDHTIRLWHGFTEADGKTVHKLVDAFNKSQSDYTVAAETIAWSSLTEKLLTSLKSGDGPHLVVQPPTDAERYIDLEALLPVEDFYTGDYESPQHYLKNYVDMVTWDQRRCGVPMGNASFCIWYNTDHWKDAGLTKDDVPSSVDELLAVARALTKTSGDGKSVDQYGIALPDNDPGTLSTLLHSGGGDFITDGVAHIDSADNIETLTTWQKAFREDKISPTGMDLVAAANLFNSGKASMLMNGPWQITGATDSGIPVDVFAWPSDWVQAATNFWFVSTLVDNATKRKGAYAFMDFFNSRNNQILWTDANYPPNRDDISAKDLDSELIATMIEFTTDGRLAVSGVRENLDDINSEVGSMFGRITGGGDVATYAHQAQAAVQNYLGDQK